MSPRKKPQVWLLVKGLLAFPGTHLSQCIPDLDWLGHAESEELP